MDELYKITEVIEKHWMPEPHICFSHKDISDVDRGGLCVLFKNLISCLQERGWRVSVITSQKYSRPGLAVYEIGSEKDPIIYSQHVSNILSRIEPDIAECSTWRFELLDFIENHNKKTKTVVRCDPPSKILFPTLGEDYVDAEKKLCRGADLLIGVSNFASAQIQKLYQVPMPVTIYNGIFVERPNGSNIIDSGELVDMASGETSPLKNYQIDQFIDRNRKNIMWIGKSTLMKGFDYLEKLVESFSDKINFIINIGYSINEVSWKRENYSRCTFVRGLTKRDKLNLWNQTDGFISTSREEGFGITVIEAMSLGLPILLNSNCRVFSEFAQYPQISLCSIDDFDNFIKSILSMGPKNPGAPFPKEFSEAEMVTKSIMEYKKLL